MSDIEHLYMYIYSICRSKADPTASYLLQACSKYMYILHNAIFQVPPPPTGVDFHTSNDYQPQQNKILFKILGFIIKCRTNTYFLKITIFVYLKKNIVSVHKQATLCSIISYINNPAAK